MDYAYECIGCNTRHWINKQEYLDINGLSDDEAESQLLAGDICFAINDLPYNDFDDEEAFIGIDDFTRFKWE